MNIKKIRRTLIFNLFHFNTLTKGNKMSDQAGYAPHIYHIYS